MPYVTWRDRRQWLFRFLWHGRHAWLGRLGSRTFCAASIRHHIYWRVILLYVRNEMAGLHLPIVEPPCTFEVQADPELGEDYDGATTFQQPGCSKQAWLFRGFGLAGLMLIGVS
jgi:hypothetical protein